MPCSPGIRKIFETVSESVVKRILAGRSVRVVPVEGTLYLFARGCEELILVEPRVRPGGALELVYALRNDEALAKEVARTGMSKKERLTPEYRRATPRRAGKNGSVA